jgi:hypothetical protein
MILESGSEIRGNSIPFRLEKFARTAGLSKLIAAKPKPALRRISRLSCSSTSWLLQNGHQSAEREKTIRAPLGPLMFSSVLVTPFWSGAENFGIALPIAGPRESGWAAAVPIVIRAVTTRTLEVRAGVNVRKDTSHSRYTTATDKIPVALALQSGLTTSDPAQDAGIVRLSYPP